MKNMKKIISMLLLACMLTAMLSASAFASGTPVETIPVRSLSLATNGGVTAVKDNVNVIFTVTVNNDATTKAGNSVTIYVNGVQRDTKVTDGNGVVTFTYAAQNLGLGDLTIDARYTVPGTTTVVKSNDVKLNVSAYVEPTISIEPSTDIVLTGLGATASVQAVVLPADFASANTLYWSIDNTAIATAAASGNSCTITAVAPGETTLVANCGGKTAFVNVRVDIPVTDLTLSTNSVNLTKSGTQEITASYSPSVAQVNGAAPVINWSIRNGGESVVSLSATTGEKCTITGNAQGSTVVYVTCGSVTKEIPVTVTDPNTPSISIAEGTSVTMTQGEAKRFTANVSNASFTRWFIEQNGNYAQISSTGNLSTDLTALSPTNLGPIKLVAQASGTNGTNVEAVCYITINSADVLSLQASPPNVTTGYTSTVTAANPLAGERFNWQYQLSAANVAVVQQHNNGEYVTVQAGSVDGYVTLTATSKTNSNRTAQIVVYVNTTAPHGNATIYPTSATWTRGNGDLTFVVKPGVYYAYLDNTLLNTLGTSYATYTGHNGVLTLKSAYLSTLASGTHTLKVYTSNSGATPDGLVYAQIYINGSASNYGDSVHVKGSGYNLYFTASDPIRNVYISNTWIDPSNYSLDATGRQLTLNANFLNQLAYGNYTMRLDTANGSSQTATFRIVAANYAPATGDDNNILVWITVLAISGAGVIALVPRKKKQM